MKKKHDEELKELTNRLTKVEKRATEDDGGDADDEGSGGAARHKNKKRRHGGRKPEIDKLLSRPTHTLTKEQKHARKILHVSQYLFHYTDVTYLFFVFTGGC